MALGGIDARLDSVVLRILDWWDANNSKARAFVAGDYLLVAWGEDSFFGATGEGLWMDSLFIGSDGIVTVVDSVNYIPKASCWDPLAGEILQVNGNLYMCVYADTEHSQTRVFTFTVNPDGTLGPIIDNAMIDGSTEKAAQAPQACRVVNGLGYMFAAYYQYDFGNDEASISTFTINLDGTINPTIDTWRYEWDGNYHAKIAHIGGNVYGCYETLKNTWHGGMYGGVLTTFAIQNDGTLPAVDFTGWIGQIGWDSEFGDGACNGYCLQIEGNIWLFLKKGTSPTYWSIASTFRVGDDGLGGGPIDTWVYQDENVAGDSSGQDMKACIIGQNEAGNGKLVALVNYSGNNQPFWPSWYRDLYIFEVLNDGTMPNKSFIDQRLCPYHEEGLNQSQQFIEMPWVCLSPDGTKLCHIYYMDYIDISESRFMIDVYDIISSTTETLTASVETLPATNILRS